MQSHVGCQVAQGRRIRGRRPQAVVHLGSNLSLKSGNIVLIEIGKDKLREPGDQLVARMVAAPPVLPLVQGQRDDLVGTQKHGQGQNGDRCRIANPIEKLERLIVGHLPGQCELGESLSNRFRLGYCLLRLDQRQQPELRFVRRKSRLNADRGPVEVPVGVLDRRLQKCLDALLPIERSHGRPRLRPPFPRPLRTLDVLKIEIDRSRDFGG